MAPDTNKPMAADAATHGLTPPPSLPPLPTAAGIVVSRADSMDVVLAVSAVGAETETGASGCPSLDIDAAVGAAVAPGLGTAVVCGAVGPASFRAVEGSTGVEGTAVEGVGGNAAGVWKEGYLWLVDVELDVVSRNLKPVDTREAVDVV
jgi:hypothetical protein